MKENACWWCWKPGGKWIYKVFLHDYCAEHIISNGLEIPKSQRTMPTLKCGGECAKQFAPHKLNEYGRCDACEKIHSEWLKEIETRGGHSVYHLPGNP